MALEHYLGLYFGQPSRDWSSVAALFEKQHLERGDYWLRAEQYARQIAFVGEGYLRIYAPNTDGNKEVTQWISSAGGLLTDLESFVFETPARWTIRALTSCTLYILSAQQYQQLSKYVSDWSTVERQFLARCFINLEQRVFQLLSMRAEERYQLLFSQQPDLFNAVPLHYLASMLGMTPETLSRLRRKSLS